MNLVATGFADADTTRRMGADDASDAVERMKKLVGVA
jgi:hypothetical protein